MNERCFLIGTSWNNSVAGNQFKALGNELADRGHRVVFIVDGRRTDIEDRESNPALCTWPSNRPVALQDASFLRQLLNEYSPDGVIAQFGSVNLMITLGWLHRVPLRVAWYHTMSEQIDLDSGHPSWKLAALRQRKRLVYEMATNAVSNSQATMNDLQETYGLAPDKTVVFSNVVADPLGGNGQLGGERIANRIVCVGRLETSKGQDVLLKALPQLVERFPSLTLELIGDGPARESCEQLAQSLGVSDHCHFRGQLTNHEVLEQMATAMVVAVPSRQEAFGIVNIEAMAVGTPVVASEVGGIPGIIRDGVDGLLVPPDCPAALSQAIVSILENRENGAEMGRQARQSFLDNYELSSSIPMIADWCLELVDLAKG